MTLAGSIKNAGLCRTHSGWSLPDSTGLPTKFDGLRRTPPILAQCHAIRVRRSPPESCGVWQTPPESVGECKVLCTHPSEMLVGITTLVGEKTDNSNTSTDVNGWSCDCGGAEVKEYGCTHSIRRRQRFTGV